MGKKVRNIIIAIIIFIPINILCKFLYNQTWFGKFKIEDDLNLVDIISVVLSTAVTIWLGLYISKRITEQRYQKEFIINDLKLIDDEIKSIQKDIVNTSSPIAIGKLIDYANNLQTAVNKFMSTLDIFDVTCRERDNLNRDFIKLYFDTTNVSGSHLNPSGPAQQAIVKSCNNMSLTARKIIKEINDM